jgi:hypothetical protein
MMAQDSLSTGSISDEQEGDDITINEKVVDDNSFQELVGEFETTKNYDRNLNEKYPQEFNALKSEKNIFEKMNSKKISNNKTINTTSITSKTFFPMNILADDNNNNFNNDDNFYNINDNNNNNNNSNNNNNNKNNNNNSVLRGNNNNNHHDSNSNNNCV